MIVDGYEFFDKPKAIRVVDVSHIFGGNDWRDPRFLAAYAELENSDPLWKDRTSSERIVATYERAGMTDPLKRLRQ